MRRRKRTEGTLSTSTPKTPIFLLLLNLPPSYVRYSVVEMLFSVVQLR